MPSHILHQSSYAGASYRLRLVCDDPDEPARRAAEVVLQRMLRRGCGYGIAGPAWREGKTQRPAAQDIPARPATDTE